MNKLGTYLATAIILVFFISPCAQIVAGDAILTWNPNTDSVSGYKVYTGIASRTYGAPIDVGNQTTYTATGLGAGTYYFAVTAYNGAGAESGYSNEVSKTIAVVDTTPPVISLVSASALTSSGATISWTTDEASDTQVDYGTTTAYGTSTTLNTSLVTAHSAALSGLTASTLYHYRVKSKDAAGNLATSGDFTFTTAADTTPPVISSIGVSSITQSGATVSWTTNEASDTQVEYGTTTAYGSSTILNTSLVTSHSAVLTGLTLSTLYHCRVKSKDAAGNLATSGDYTFTTAADTTAPSVPAGLTATAVSTTQINLSWTASTDNVGVAGYTIYRNGMQVRTSTVTSYQDSGLTPSTSYSYTVSAYDGAGNNSAQSTTASATTQAMSSACVPANVRCVSGVAGPTQEYATIQAAAGVAQPGDTVLVYDGNYAGFEVTASGTPAAPISFKAASSNAVVNADGPTGDGIRLEDASYVTVQGFQIKSPTQRCIAATGASAAAPMQGLSIVGNSCDKSGAEGIYLSNASGAVVQGNTVTNAGRGSNASGHGISVADGGSNNVTVKGNVVTASSGDGIQVNADAAGGGAGIIQGLLLDSNSISGSVSNGVELDGVQSSRVQNNLVYGNGVNALLGAQGGGAQGPRNLAVVNNTLVVPASGAFAMKLTEDLGGHTVFNNILLSDSVSGGSLAVSNGGLVSGTNAVVDRFSLNGGASLISLAQWQASGYDGGSFLATAANLFVNAAGSDYHLQSGSPAVDAGQASLAGVAAPSVDLEGNPRPQGRGYDVGAYESSYQGADTTPPTVPTNLTASAASSTQINLSWRASTDNVGVTGYKIYRNGTQVGTSTATTYPDTGLTPSTAYSYTVAAYDAAGNTSAASAAVQATTLADTTPPVISAVTATAITTSGATITWTTNEPADSQVEFGTTIRYGSLSSLNSSLVTNHTVVLNGLNQGTTYYFRVRSRDASGNLALSGSFTFKTQVVTPPLAISAVSVTNIRSNQATINWTTNVSSTSKVEDGTTSSLGSASALSSTMVVKHSVTLKNLTSRRTYYYRVDSKDANGNLAVSSIYSFTTSR